MDLKDRLQKDESISKERLLPLRKDYRGAQVEAKYTYEAIAICQVRDTGHVDQVAGEVRRRGEIW